MKILVTGSSGFIGYHLCLYLLKKGFQVIGIDNINSYYDINLKKDRNRELENLSIKRNYSWKFFLGDIEDKEFLIDIFKKFNPEIIINLAAQAGVRYSLENPEAYIKSNIFGFFNILECCKEFIPKHLIYASSSSVYGGNDNIPFKEKDQVDKPESLYAATKISNELMAYTYSNLYGIPSTGLRFFTVYGPWGRPDMAPMIFTKSILEGKPIKIFNYGNMERDFTFIDDVIISISKLINQYPLQINTNNTEDKLKKFKKFVPHRVINVGNSNPVKLKDFINLLELGLNKIAIKEYLPMQSGDVQKTYADTTLIEVMTEFKPSTPLEKGIRIFLDWYLDYFNKRVDKQNF